MALLGQSKWSGSDLKLIALDMDGTLLNQRGHISGENLSAIEEARSRGIEITLVTGRHISKVLPFVEQLTLTVPFVTSNGCEVWSPDGTLLQRSTLSLLERQWIQQWAVQHNLGYRAYCVDGVFDWTPETMGSDDAAGGSEEVSDSPGYTEREWLKVLLEDARAKTPGVAQPSRATAAAGTAAADTGLQPRCLSGLYARLEADPRFALAAYSIDPARIDRIDVHPAGVDKAAGLQAVCRLLDVTAAQVAAFGDDTNDIAMLRWAGLGVAMEHAPAAVLAAADAIAPHHNRDGVAVMIRRLLS